jgi:hypothetical protein
LGFLARETPWQNREILKARKRVGQDQAMEAKYPPEVEEAMRGLFESLSERERRLYAAVEAAKLGRGGLAYLANVLGCDEKTIRRGRRELVEPAHLPPGRSRKKGADGTN